MTGSGMLAMALVFSVSLDNLSPIHAGSCPREVTEPGRQEAGPELRGQRSVIVRLSDDWRLILRLMLSGLVPGLHWPLGSPAPASPATGDTQLMI